MENKAFDEALKNALTPSARPRESVDQTILEKLQFESLVMGGGEESVQALKDGEEKGHEHHGRMARVHKWSALPKAAAIVLVIAVLGAGSVYAAGKIMDKINVLNHGISVGNQEYVKDEDLAQPWESVSVENKGEEAPGPDDKWAKKRSELVSGRYLNVFYHYDKYEDAVADSRFESLFREIPGEEQSVIYCTIDMGDGTMEYSIDAIFEYETGIVSTYQSVMEGNVASDAAYSIVMKQTGNARTYVSASGTEFSLVDDLAAGEDGLSTIVLISYDNIRGYIGFRGLSEEQIHRVLDLVVIE